MCGEHCHWLSVEVTPLGSSPHVRGARRLWSVFGSVTGIIPACAGSTRSTTARSPGIRDHPRMCGEHWQCPPKPAWSSGSSPHMRGARAPRAISKRWVGIIPACAGSTSCGSGLPLGSRDHPRMCGEHISARPSSVLNRGSSPHVRGARIVGVWVDQAGGIIPACAGSTRGTCRRRARRRDHPRMCGEH